MTAHLQPTEVSLAPFIKRLFAWVYDLLGALGIFVLALVLGQIILYLVTLPWIDDFAEFSTAIGKNPIWWLYLFLAVQYYYVWCWVKGGQTVGMKAWRLQIYSQRGDMLNWKEAYFRSFASLGGIGHMWSLIDSKKRGLQDLAVSSKVVELPKDFYKKKNKGQEPLI